MSILARTAGIARCQCMALTAVVVGRPVARLSRAGTATRIPLLSRFRTNEAMSVGNLYVTMYSKCLMLVLTVLKIKI